ncbi:MAG: hypothetical protein ACOCXP_02230 [Candidatus Dojkabacteria bacterium]
MRKKYVILVILVISFSIFFLVLQNDESGEESSTGTIATGTYYANETLGEYQQLVEKPDLLPLPSDGLALENESISESLASFLIRNSSSGVINGTYTFFVERDGEWYHLHSQPVAGSCGGDVLLETEPIIIEDGESFEASIESNYSYCDYLDQSVVDLEGKNLRLILTGVDGTLYFHDFSF